MIEVNSIKIFIEKIFYIEYYPLPEQEKKKKKKDTFEGFKSTM